MRDENSITHSRTSVMVRPSVTSMSSIGIMSPGFGCATLRNHSASAVASPLARPGRAKWYAPKGMPDALHSLRRRA